MQSIFGIGLKQTDYEIMKYLSDFDIKSLACVNKQFNKRCNEEDFWMARVFQKYGKYLKDIDVKPYVKTWKSYYIELKALMADSYPYYISAIYTNSKRKDVLLLLENFKRIKNVKPVVVTNENEVSKYYTRNGDPKGIKEGFSYTVSVDDFCDDLATVKDRTEKCYKNGKLLWSTTYQNNKLLIRELYKDGKEMHTIKWHKNGNKIFERKRVAPVYFIAKEWFVTGEPKCEKSFTNDKKHGLWVKWDKQGNRTTQGYYYGKKADIDTSYESNLEMWGAFENLEPDDEDSI